MGSCLAGMGEGLVSILPPFLFQRARLIDEELNRRGSPLPKKVGGFSTWEILCFWETCFLLLVITTV